jgi:phosphate:Na+ symporter
MTGLLMILGGLALFMFGIRLLSSGMEKLAGEKIQKWLGKVTENRLKSAVFGTVGTAFLQSSGLLMVTMIGLINANLMTVPQSIGIMLGQEIGTTITAQIVAFDIGASRLLLVIVGLFFLEFFANHEWKKYGEILMGLGLIFVGMSYMSKSLEHLVQIKFFADGLVTMGQRPFVGILAGLIATSITQSSTAVTSMAVAMGMNNSITLGGAIGIILGANIGSCITGLVASLGQARAARQASIAQIMINVFGVICFMPFIAQYTKLVEMTSSELPRQIANAHTIFNVLVSLALLPFIKQIAQFSAFLTPASRVPEKPKVTAFIDEMQFSVPSVALSEAARELVRMGEITAQMFLDSYDALIHLDSKSIKHILSQEEKVIDPVFRELEKFINMLLSKELTIAQQQRCFQIKKLLADVERVGDLAEDMAEFALERIESKAEFSAPALEELKQLWAHAHRTYGMAIRAFSTSDKELAKQVSELEREFDKMYWRTRQAHIHRIEEGRCHPQADVIFTETLRMLERISDHADNVAVSVTRATS